MCTQDCPRKSFKDVNIWDLVWHLKEILFTHSSYWSNNIPCLAHLCFSPPLINDLTYFRLLKSQNQNYCHNLDNRDADLLRYLIGYIISTFSQEFNNIPMRINAIFSILFYLQGYNLNLKFCFSEGSFLAVLREPCVVPMMGFILTTCKACALLNVLTLWSKST